MCYIRLLLWPTKVVTSEFTQTSTSVITNNNIRYVQEPVWKGQINQSFQVMICIMYWDASGYLMVFFGSAN